MDNALRCHAGVFECLLGLCNGLFHIFQMLALHVRLPIIWIRGQVQRLDDMQQMNFIIRLVPDLGCCVAHRTVRIALSDPSKGIRSLSSVPFSKYGRSLRLTG
jgi:hypothetical protein